MFSVRTTSRQATCLVQSCALHAIAECPRAAGHAMRMNYSCQHQEDSLDNQITLAASSTISNLPVGSRNRELPLQKSCMCHAACIASLTP